MAAPATSETTAVARRYFDAVTARSPDAMADCWAPGAVDTLVGDQELVAPEGVRTYFSELFGAFPDFAFEVRSMITEGDRCAVLWRARGTFPGPGSFPGGRPPRRSGGGRGGPPGPRLVPGRRAYGCADRDGGLRRRRGPRRAPARESRPHQPARARAPHRPAAAGAVGGRGAPVRRVQPAHPCSAGAGRARRGAGGRRRLGDPGRDAGPLGQRVPDRGRGRRARVRR